MGWGEKTQMAPHAGTLARRLYDYILYSIRYMDMSDICEGVAEIAEDIVNEKGLRIVELEAQIAELQSRVALLASFKSTIQKALHKHDNPSSRIDPGW